MTAPERNILLQCVAARLDSTDGPTRWLRFASWRRRPMSCLRLGSERNDLGFAGAGLRLDGFGEELLLGLFPVVEGISGRALTLEIDVVGPQGNFAVGGNRPGCRRFARFGRGVCCGFRCGLSWHFWYFLLIPFSHARSRGARRGYEFFALFPLRKPDRDIWGE